MNNHLNNAEKGFCGSCLHEDGRAAQSKDEGEEEDLAEEEEEDPQRDGEGQSRERLPKDRQQQQRPEQALFRNTQAG
jgi:hypothetical protein